ncbi:hypothetical protein B0H14DRAFT_1327675 [Mycena olivaceomarginata]|nr:hypothetical protein B0H14DRAFT_1327675 [Mycena olivaceomarginata]
MPAMRSRSQSPTFACPFFVFKASPRFNSCPLAARANCKPRRRLPMRWGWRWIRARRAAVASRSSPTRKRCAVDRAPVRKLKISCTTATTLRYIQARFVARTTFPRSNPTQPAQVDSSSSAHLPKARLRSTESACSVLTPDSGHTPPLSSRFKLDCTTLRGHAMSVPAPAILLPPTPSPPPLCPFLFPPFPPSCSLPMSTLGSCADQLAALCCKCNVALHRSCPAPTPDMLRASPALPACP